MSKLKYRDIDKIFLNLLDKTPSLQARWDEYLEQVLKVQELAERECLEIINNQKDLDPKIVKFVNENFWELLA